jgi:hypothetical protein
MGSSIVEEIQGSEGNRLMVERVNRGWERINRTGSGGGSGESLVYKERTESRKDMT